MDVRRINNLKAAKAWLETYIAGHLQGEGLSSDTVADYCSLCLSLLNKEPVVDEIKGNSLFLEWSIYYDEDKCFVEPCISFLLSSDAEEMSGLWIPSMEDDGVFDEEGYPIASILEFTELIERRGIQYFEDYVLMELNRRHGA